MNPQETPISAIVEIQGGYSSYVDLRLDLFDDSQNIGRMAQYRPIASHRLAFERLARTLNVKDKRCYLLTGSYGTGKSHLCLMFANYLMTPSDENPMPAFFENYAEVDSAASEGLRAKRLQGRYLAAVCEWGGRGDFEEIVLRAVDEALHREGFGDDFETHYLHAIRKIDEWEQFDQSNDPRGHFYGEFQNALQALTPPQTVAAFRRRLGSFDYPVLEEFKRLHLALTTAPFAYDKSSLLTILTNTLCSEAFKDRYQGLLVLFDEFGETMERGNLSPKMFQQFAQLAADTPANAARLIFVGTAHKPFTTYAKAYSTTDFRTASDRVEEVPLTPDGIEDIISAIVVPQKDHELWKKTVSRHNGLFDSFLTDCNRLGLFNWLKGPKIRQKIIENIYPMHPMATYALLQLARDIASNNRSVFTFFSGDLGGENAPGSYGYFIANMAIESGTNGSSKLTLYTADLLCDYFADTLTSDNRELRETIRDILKNYENSRRELNRIASENDTLRMQLQGDLFVERILRLMLIYDIIQIPNRMENLAFGLYATTNAERAELVNRLTTLMNAGILYRDKDTSVYEFKKSKAVDLDRRVEEYKQDPNNQPPNIVAALSELVPFTKSDQYLEARDYNLSYAEDKRLERRLVRPADLGSETDTPWGKRTYFQALEEELQRDARRSDHEGFALYAVCQTVEEIQRVRDFCARNESDRIVVAVPREPVPLLDAVMELKALQFIERSADAQNFTSQDKAALSARINGERRRPGAQTRLRDLRDKLINSREVAWYGKYANALAVDESKLHDPANRVMEAQYSDHRNKFTHDDFNKLHKAVDRTKNAGLKEAVEKLLDYTQPILIDTSFPQARGEIRYLQNCLLYNGVLRQVRIEGSKLRCELESNPAKYSTKLPPLAAMIEEVRALPPDRSVKLIPFLTKYRQPPYGQGPVALALGLACIRRLFSDSIRIKREESAIGELRMNSFDEVMNIIDAYYANANLSYRPLRDEEIALTTMVYSVFGQVDSASDAARTYTINEAYDALKAWWEALPPLAHVRKLYPPEGEAVAFIGTMDKIASKDAHNFLFDDLPAALGFEAGQVVTQEMVNHLQDTLPQIKATLEHALDGVKEQIFEGIRQVFGVQQHTYSDIIQCINEWYNSLDANQRDSHARWHDKNSKPLVMYLKTISDLEETFLERIPVSPDYGMKKVAEWGADRTSEYLERLKQGKDRIDAARLTAEPPEILIDGDYEAEGNQVRFKGAVTLALHASQPGTRMYIAEGEVELTDPNALREELIEGQTINIRDHKMVRYAAQDADGNWSQVQVVQFVNEHKKFELAFQGQRVLLQDDLVQFVFPQDSASFKVSCESLFQLSLDRGVVTVAELEAYLESIIEGLRATDQ